jgi:hypothetical protein
VTVTPRDVVLRRPRAIFDLSDEFAAARRPQGETPRPFGPLRFRLVARLPDGGRDELREPIDLVMRQNPSGYHVFFGQVAESGDDRRDLPEGRYEIRVDSWYYQPATFALAVPDPEAGPLTPPEVRLRRALAPGHRYPFRFTGRPTTQLVGSAHRTDGSGLEDVLVRSAPALHEYRTGRDGQWMLAFPESRGSGPVDVEVTPHGEAPVTISATLRAGRQTSLAQTSLRGSVRTEPGLRAAATISVSGEQETSTSRPDGRWFFYFRPGFVPDPADPFVDVAAALPDGRALVRPGVRLQPHSSVPVPPFDFASL